MITVKDVLKTTPFKKGIVIAGEKGLTNPVKTITVAETPDAANWLRGGEIVCTAGFLIKNQSVTENVKWVESLINNNAVALAIKTSRFLGEVPEPVKLMSNSRNFPLISLPDDVTWPYIIEAVINLVNDKNVSQLQRGTKIHEKLTQLVLDGNNVSEIAKTISDLVSNPIIVEDGRLNIITSAIPASSTIEEESHNYVEIRTSDIFQKKILHSDYYRHVLSDHTKEILQLPLTKQNAPKAVSSITIPILASNIVYGFLTLLKDETELTSTDFLTLEHGANAIAIQLVKDSIESKNRYKTEQATIQKLLHGRLSPSTLGSPFLRPIDWATPMVVVLIESLIETTEEGLFVFNPPKEMFEKIIKENIRNHFGDCIVGYEQNLFNVFIPIQVCQSQETLSDVKETLESCMAVLRKTFPTVVINIAIGGLYSSRTKLKKSYEDAKKTLEIMKMIPSLGQIASFTHTGIYRLIQKIEDYEFLKSFKDDYLSNLIEHDEKNRDTLCATLRTYLQAEGNVTVAAKELFVHPNTIMYRLRKIKTIIGNPLDNPQYRDSLLFALEIGHYLNALEK
jgi:purine catabolism regulator